MDNSIPPREETLPSGWARATDLYGRTYYYNMKTKESAWDLPVREQTRSGGNTVPNSDWSRVLDPLGRQYFWNVKTNETRWSHPEHSLHPQHTVQPEFQLQSSDPSREGMLAFDCLVSFP
uniref:WW domain-containing protein n=1 Tax=Tetraselmis sp. GSL018 TaxID=582737 RepID=A0A061RY85_9CHLO